MEGHFVDGHFVEGRFVEGRFVLAPYNRTGKMRKIIRQSDKAFKTPIIGNRKKFQFTSSGYLVVVYARIWLGQYFSCL